MNATRRVRRPPGPVRAITSAPGSKSLSNRALLLAALADGRSRIVGCLDADDTRLMLGCLTRLGLEIELQADLAAGIDVLGSRRLGHGEGVPALDVGTAGTVARFLTAALAAIPNPSWTAARIDGSPRMRERPMATLLDALAELGARFECEGQAQALPLLLHAGAGLRGGALTLDRPASSQFVSALAIAGCLGQAPLEIVLREGTPARPYVDMTLAVIEAFGGAARWVDDGVRLRIEPRPLSPTPPDAPYIVEPDASAASYLLALPAIWGGEVTVPDLGRDSLQGDAQFFEVLARFGAAAEQGPRATTVRGGASLRGVELDLTDMPDMTLTAAVVALFAEGPTRIRGVEILRHHESDRLAAGATELRKLGATVTEHPGGLDITPPPGGPTRGVVIDTYLDHRMAMAFAMVGDVEIDDPGCVDKTFPRYFEVLAELGMTDASRSASPSSSAPQVTPAPPSPLQVGDRRELDVEAVDEQGLGRASAEGRAWQIANALPGERVEVRVEALARHSDLAHARVITWLEHHPARRSAPCDRHLTHTRAPGDRRPKPSCGGCSLMTLGLDAQREAKRAWIERAYGLRLDGPVVGGEGLSYRWSSKRIVSGEPGRLRLGSRAPGHKRGQLVADMRGCLVDHPRLRAAFDALEDRANVLGIAPWTAKDQASDLRYVWAKTNGEQVLLTLITAAESSRAAAELGPWLVAEGHADGVAHSVQAGGGNAIRGAAPTTLAGIELLRLRVPEPPALEVGPLGFLQPNPVVAGMAYAALVAELDALGPETLVFDLYAGAGLTCAALRERFETVIPCESYPESAARLGVAAERVQDMLAASLAGRHPRPGLVVANPPRAGLGAEVCAQLVELAAPRVRVMSCSAKTLAADLDRLAPHYVLTRLRGFDTLPQTGHLELVAWLERRDAPA